MPLELTPDVAASLLGVVPGVVGEALPTAPANTALVLDRARECRLPVPARATRRDAADLVRSDMSFACQDRRTNCRSTHMVGKRVQYRSQLVGLQPLTVRSASGRLIHPWLARALQDFFTGALSSAASAGEIATRARSVHCHIASTLCAQVYVTWM